MESEQHYFRPRVDERTYETAVEKATFLVDNMYVNLTTGYTFEILVQELINRELKNKSYINR